MIMPSGTGNSAEVIVPSPPISIGGDDCSHCSHCGQLVIGSRISDGQGDAFCCEGCRAIHGWLKSSRLEGYYDLMKQGGRKAPQATIGEDYKSLLASLDEPGALAGMGRWTGARHDLALESGEITCAGCGWLLERLLQGSKGVRTFDVDFIHGEAYLEYDSSLTTLKEILSVPAGFGYRLRPKSGAEPARPAPDRALLYRLAVSGACFVNTMAFSLAVYLGAFRGMPQAWLDAFGMMGLALSVPAVGYAAFPFFSGAWGALKAGRFNIDVTVSIGILLSFAVTVSSVFRAEGGNYSDSLTGLIFFLLLGRWAVRRFEAGLALKGRWFNALRPGRIRVRRGGKIEMIGSGETREGEIVELLGGEYAPMDGTLEATEAWMDTSLLTGESRASRFRFGDAVFAGYLNVKGRIAVRTFGTSGTTRIAGLGKVLDALVSGRRSMPDGVGKVAKWFTFAVLACGFATLAIHWNEGAGKALAAAASVFIISCSCALALAAPISRGLGLRRAMALGFHFRAHTSLEALRDVKCVLFDKTGTLTFTRRTVSAWTWTETFADDGGSEDVALQAIKTLSGRSLHPVAQSLHRTLESTPESGWRLQNGREVAHFGMVGRFACGEAAPIRELCICRFAAWEEPDGEFRRLGYAKPFPEATGSRPLPVADSCIFLDGVLIALIRFTDEIKPDVAALVSGLERSGVTAVLLSGDNPAKVEAFAGSCGFRHFHAGLTPEDKGSWAAEYRERYGPCLAVGDGFNDNLLFGASDLAMAVHGGAVDLSKGTDILFTGPRPSDLIRLFAFAGKVKRSIGVSFWVSGLYNAAAIAVAMRGGVSPLFAAVLMPLSSLSLCLVALWFIRAPSAAPRSTAWRFWENRGCP